MNPLIDALMMASGWTAPQDIAGLAKFAGTTLRSGHLPKMRLQDGAMLYENPNLDTPAAATGRFVELGPGSSSDPDAIAHEMRHVAQSSALGPAMIPASLLEALGSQYGAGPLERDAMKHVTPNTEMQREGSPEYVKPSITAPAGMALLKMLLGK